MKKKKILAIAIVAVLTSVAATGTLAYYTASEKAHNVITSGGIGIEIIEKTKVGSGTELEEDFPNNGIRDVMPGMSVSKIVKIKNTGASEAWIRVKMESSIVGADRKDLPLVIGENDKEPVMEYEVLKDWTLGKDGYYYYEKPVEPEKTTDLLIDSVKFNPAMGNEYQGCTANITIAAEAVQTANNGRTVEEAKGWTSGDSKEGGKS